MTDREFKKSIILYYKDYNEAIMSIQNQIKLFHSHYNPDEKIYLDNPMLYLCKTIEYAENILSRFTYINNIGRLSNININEIYERIFKTNKLAINFKELYDNKKIIPHKYIEIYYIYRLLYVIKHCFNIEDKEIKLWFNKVFNDYESALSNWIEKYFSYKVEFNIREEIITKYIMENYCIPNTLEASTTYIEASKEIKHNINTKKPEDSYSDETRNVYKYMHYYLLPRIIKDDSLKKYYTCYSYAMLEVLDTIVDEETKEKINYICDQYLVNKDKMKRIG